ncbi:hypothetical protein [Streptomyces graminilatus]|uniref:hypothetical protein n=1 Tax=Streptomyces graminilatus TaxID=1464070 RepID=UPI0006E3736F|nr:hypothetical protein [Streptomyces graminilatus]
MAAEYDGIDALMAALTDDPLPEEALTDADFMAEHWSAAADVALLREQLGLIGGALAHQEQEHTEPEPVRRPARIPVRERPYRRPLRTLALGVVGVTAVGTLFAGSAWLVSQAGNGAEDSGAGWKADTGTSATVTPQNGGAGAKSGGARYLACARLVVEGTVTAVDPGPDAGQDRITLRVNRYYKPDKGPAEVTFLMDQDVDPRLTKGDDTLIGIPADAVSPDTWTVGEGRIAVELAWITAALPASRTLQCERR